MADHAMPNMRYICPFVVPALAGLFSNRSRRSMMKSGYVLDFRLRGVGFQTVHSFLDPADLTSHFYYILAQDIELRLEREKVLVRFSTQLGKLVFDGIEPVV
jgi:hypothetical protein